MCSCIRVFSAIYFLCIILYLFLLINEAETNRSRYIQLYNNWLKIIQRRDLQYSIRAFRLVSFWVRVVDVDDGIEWTHPQLHLCPFSHWTFNIFFTSYHFPSRILRVDWNSARRVQLTSENRKKEMINEEKIEGGEGRDRWVKFRQNGNKCDERKQSK